MTEPTADHDGQTATQPTHGAEKSSTEEEPIHVRSRTHLTELVDGDDPVLADFYADWCGPCQQLEPIVASVAADSPATVAKVDVDEHQQLAAKYGVRGVPTMVFFVDGEPVERVVGLRSESDLLELIDEYV
ncbi:thioredoxin family protein [Halobaculum sp. MBLA0147]|uniref:thioredoxin family protein n=1 Tax=Halobaculum sp. MBLA0147 TaxID=3079934 RepID=UPI0035234917